MFDIKKICIVGAGPAGMCAIRHAVESNFEVVAFEKQDSVGGNWIYTDKTGVDENGVEIHSSMYENLMTNIPKEIMQFPGFPYPYEDRSFVSREKIIHYLNLFADYFDIRKNIRFGHEVVRVRPLSNEKWEVIVRNIAENKFECFNFDGILLCNGFSFPYIPKIPGQDVFKGKQIHSHDYRTGRSFENEKVLVLGSGPSGIEMALQIGEFAEKLIWSHHDIDSYTRDVGVTLRGNSSHKPDIKLITENEVFFVDGTREEITVIVYGTGYDNKFPFLSVDCGLSVTDKHIYPLFKHLININRPSMALFNIPQYAIAFALFDLQARFVLKIWTNAKPLPSREDMLSDTKADIEQRKRQKIKSESRKFHYLGLSRHKEYYVELSDFAEIEPIPPVFGKVFDASFINLFENFNIYRNYEFKILDNENFTMKLQRY